MATSKITHDTEGSYTITAGTGYASNAWSLERVNGIISFVLRDVKAMPAGSFSMSGAIPEAYRPRTEKNFTLIKRASTPTPLAVTIKTNGNIDFYNYGSATTGATPFAQTMTWVAN